MSEQQKLGRRCPQWGRPQNHVSLPVSTRSVNYSAVFEAPPPPTRDCCHISVKTLIFFWIVCLHSSKNIILFLRCFFVTCVRPFQTDERPFQRKHPNKNTNTDWPSKVLNIYRNAEPPDAHLKPPTIHSFPFHSTLHLAHQTARATKWPCLGLDLAPRNPLGSAYVTAIGIKL